MKWAAKADGAGKHGHGLATADDIQRLFAEYRDALEWLAGFLTGDDKLGAACVVDACAIAETQSQVFHEWLVEWARRATIRCAVEMQHAAVAQLAPTYERRSCVHTEHSPLSPDSVRLLVEESDVIRGRLDVVCRFALIMRGIEEYSPQDAALQLGISRTALEAAYCFGIEALEIIRCELLSNSDGPAAAYN